MSLFNKYFGPSTFIAAAFIGPGTITICTLAGVNTSYSLLWALAFSTIATVILQEMSARLGFVTQEGLGEAVHNTIKPGLKKQSVLLLIISAILIGNAAYESGNITGAVIGLELITGEQYYFPVLVGGLAFVLLFKGNYKAIETFLIAMVILMSCSFLITAFLVIDDIGAILKGFIPGPVSKDELLLVMGLIGTTVVPYNLFLHASLISKKWKPGANISDIRKENSFSIILGGIISALIVIVAAASSNELTVIKGGQDLAVQLKPFLGSFAEYLMGLGLFAAGLSSAITAALAAAYVAKGIFKIKNEKKSIAFKSTWMLILFIGTIVSLLGFNNILLIKFAQITNALLLPIIAVFLLYCCQSEHLMGIYKNTSKQNIIASIVILLTLVLSIKTFLIIF